MSATTAQLGNHVVNAAKETLRAGWLILTLIVLMTYDLLSIGD